MGSGSYERMIALAEECFHMSEDPSGVLVTEALITKLRCMHPKTLTEECDDAGPIAWVLVLPTTHALMTRFLEKQLTERQLFDVAPVDVQFEALYLCSALVLPEYRRQGIARRLLVGATKALCDDHPIRELAFWPFTAEGKHLALAVAKECGLPLLERER